MTVLGAANEHSRLRRRIQMLNYFPASIRICFGSSTTISGSPAYRRDLTADANSFRFVVVFRLCELAPIVTPDDDSENLNRVPYSQDGSTIIEHSYTFERSRSNAK
jgi:hypothetical protein